MSVVGTIFSVNHGAKGSRVSVIEGEVHVRQGAELAVLLPGQQLATGHRLAAVALADEISWSRDAARYRERLAALKSLGRELDLALVPESARTSTRLLDLVPAGTGVYVALPNLSQSLGTAWQLVQQRVAENPVLGEWWSEHFANPQDEAEISQAIAELERFGGELGAEIVVAIDRRETAGNPARRTSAAPAALGSRGSGALLAAARRGDRALERPVRRPQAGSEIGLRAAVSGGSPIRRARPPASTSCSSG